MSVYIFIRENTFYPLELEPTFEKTDDEVAIENALYNPGTIQVKKCVAGGGEVQTIWEHKEDS